MTDRDNAPTPTPRWRSPALIGGGLAVIAVIVVTAVVLLRDDEDDTGTEGPTTAESTAAPDTTAPTSEPSTSPAPATTDLGPTDVVLSADRGAGCITVTTAAGSASGCPQQGTDVQRLDQRTFVANLDGPILITAESSDPFTDAVATVDDGAFATRCRWDDLAPRIPDGRMIEVVVCNDTGVMSVPTADRRPGRRRWRRLGRRCRAVRLAHRAVSGAHEYCAHRSQRTEWVVGSGRVEREVVDELVTVDADELTRVEPDLRRA